ncbi:MAG TPA: hypothetical protein VNI58_10725 [Mariprofundaceae bacterium]|nr:hypothetical protein [Mariprofundaceae bacterium]
MDQKQSVLSQSLFLLAACAMLAAAPAYAEDKAGAAAPAPNANTAQQIKPGSADHNQRTSTGMTYSEKAAKGMKSNPMGAASQITGGGIPPNSPLSSGGDDGTDKTGN